MRTLEPLREMLSARPEKRCPQGLKPMVLSSLMYGLKPVPFHEKKAVPQGQISRVRGVAHSSHKTA